MLGGAALSHNRGPRYLPHSAIDVLYVLYLYSTVLTVRFRPIARSAFAFNSPPPVL